MEPIHASTSLPRISANLLGEFTFASEGRRRAILRGHKFPRARSTKAVVSHYSSAQWAILRSLTHGKFDAGKLRSEKAAMVPKKPDDERSVSRCQDNRAAIESFLTIGEETDLPAGEHFKTRKNSQLLLDGVVISARPEIITEDRKQGRVSFTKFRFSKSKLSADESEIILLAMLKFGEEHNWKGMNFDLKSTRLIDCFSKSVIWGHQLPLVRESQLAAALTEVRRLWPTITPPS